jgi:hypothetical protein
MVVENLGLQTKAKGSSLSVLFNDLLPNGRIETALLYDTLLTFGYHDLATSRFLPDLSTCRFIAICHYLAKVFILSIRI